MSVREGATNAWPEVRAINDNTSNNEYIPNFINNKGILGVVEGA